MSSTRCEPSLRIEPQRSRLLQWFLVVNFSGATLILSVALPVIYALPLALLCWLYFYRLYRYHVLRNRPDSIRLLVRETSGEWLLHTYGGAEEVVTLSASSYLHSQLIILILRAGAARYTLVLLRDSLATDTFRELAVRLGAEQHAAA